MASSRCVVLSRCRPRYHSCATSVSAVWSASSPASVLVQASCSILHVKGLVQPNDTKKTHTDAAPLLFGVNRLLDGLEVCTVLYIHRMNTYEMHRLFSSFTPVITHESFSMFMFPADLRVCQRMPLMSEYTACDYYTGDSICDSFLISVK